MPSQTSLWTPNGPKHSASKLFGSTTPRLWTPPLRELTPDTSVGFNQVKFATNRLKRPPLPWQEWLLIHAGELLEDGRPRFRIVILLVARQNGKTEVVVILPPYWMFVDDSPLILGTSTKLEYAKESWNKTRKLIRRSTALKGLYDPNHWYLLGAGNTEMWAYDRDDAGDLICDKDSQGPRYKIAAANEEGGRSLTVHRGIVDELRQHKDFKAWEAIEPACSYDDSQLWAASNAGSDASVVLNMLVGEATEFIEHGIGNYRVGLFSWSAEDDADPEDPAAILQANPRVGYGGKSLEDLQMEAAVAVRAGGEKLTGFKTEKLCIRVKVMNPAIDPGAWLRCRNPGTLDSVRKRLAACLDVAPDGGHVALLVAGVLDDDMIRIEVAGAWSSIGEARRDLPALLGKIRPLKFGWFPEGPASAMAPDLQLPPGYSVEAWKRVGEPIRGDMAAACMGLEEQVRSRKLWHSGDLLLDQHVGDSERLPRGRRWIFVSNSGGHINGAYAAAGAVFLARTMPRPVGPLRVIVSSED